MDINIQYYLNLMGRSTNALVLTGEACNEEEALKTKNPVTFIFAHFVKLQLAVYMNDIPAAKAVSERIEKMDEKKLLPFMGVTLHFFQGLTHAISNTRTGNRKAKRHLAKVKVAAKHAPFNFLHKAYLIEAELASQAGKFDDAMASFVFAIQLARQEGMIHDQALANERAAYASMKRGCPREAQAYISNAQSLYSQWGAQAKVDQLAGAWRIVQNEHLP